MAVGEGDGSPPLVGSLPDKLIVSAWDVCIVTAWFCSPRDHSWPVFDS